MRFSHTQFSFQSVVSFGSSSRDGVSTTVEPLNFTRATVPTLLVFKGTHSWYAARTSHEVDIINGQSSVKTRANGFKHQLLVGCYIEDLMYIFFSSSA